MTNIDEILRGMKRRNLGYPSESIFSSRREDEDDEAYSKPNPFNILNITKPRIYPSESIFSSRREDEDDEWQREQERRREEDFRRIADHVQIDWDIFKGSTQAHVGLAQVYTSAGLHPIAKLELLKMGIRP